MKLSVTALFFILLLPSCTTSYNASVKSIGITVSDYNTPLPQYTDDRSVFWNYVKSCNTKYNKYKNDNSKLKRNVEYEINKSLMTDNFSYQLTETDRDFLKYYCGEEYTDFIKNVVILNSNEIDAYSTPDGYVNITKGIINLLDNMNQIDGVITHEIAHIVLEHSKVHEYANRKQKRKNEIWAGVLMGLAGAAVLGAQIAHVESGARYTEDNGQQYNEIYRNSVNAIQIGYDDYTIRKWCEYSREQEVEADIIACLFLIWTKRDPLEYVNALSKLSDTPQITKYDTHPSLQFRISTIRKFLYEYKQSGKFNQRAELNSIALVTSSQSSKNDKSNKSNTLQSNIFVNRSLQSNSNEIFMNYYEKKGSSFNEEFSIMNNLKKDVSSITIRFIYKLENGAIIYTVDYTLQEKIQKGTSKKFTRRSFDQKMLFAYKYSDSYKNNYTLFTVDYKIINYK